MKRTLLFIPLLLLAASLRLVAQTVTVQGHVTNFADGSGKADHPVWISSDNPADPLVFTTTDADGFYSVELNFTPAGGMVEVSTVDSCNQTALSNFVPVVNGVATADFILCQDFPWPDSLCYVYAGFYWNDPGSPLTVSFYPVVEGPLDYTLSWDFGDGQTSTELSPVHTYAEEGTYTITLTMVSPNCVNSTQITLELPAFYTGPTVEVTVTGNVSTASGNPAPNWWVQAIGFIPFYFWDDATDANGNYEITVVIPDTATTVEVRTFDACGLLSQVVPVVNNTATADFVLCDDFPPLPDCQVFITYTTNDGLTYNFSAMPYTMDPADAVVSYAWDFGDGNTSTEANPSHTYAEDGVYTVTLTITTASGCVAHACDVVCTFGGGIIDTFYYGCQAMFGVGWGIDPNNPIGGGNSLELSFVDLSFGAVQSWFWDFGDGNTSTEQNPTHTYAQAGLYLITLHIETLDGCESEIQMEVYVGDFPWSEYDCQAMFFPIPDSTGNGFLFLDLSMSPGPIQSWNWDFGDGNTSTEQNPFHNYAQPGVYTVTLSITADSCNSTISFELDTTDPFFRFGGNGGVLGLATGASSTSELPAFEQARLFPNPATDEATLAFTSRETADFELRLSNLSGQTVLSQQQKAAAGPNAVRVPLSDLTPGIYLVQLRSDNQVETLKLMKN
ncbi:MAG: PKD domain-containing protein [Saprospiraceae bacterium]|nr:PKD domain-containing protein [Saprospiraceae bacterium]